VHHYGLNLYSRQGKLIAAASQIDGLSVLDRVGDRVPEWVTEYTDIDIHNSSRLARMITGHASRDDAEKRMLWRRRLAHVSLNALGIMLSIIDGPRMTTMYDCGDRIKCKVDRKPFTLSTTSRATDSLWLLHSDIC